MTKQRAYEILELEQGSTKDQVKKKYENFMRLTKFDKSYDEKLLTKAFDLLMGVNWGDIENEQDYYEKGLNKKKIENFFYHYKRHMIFGGIALITFSLIFISIFSRNPKPDVGILIIGNALVDEIVPIEDYFENTYEIDFVRVIPINIGYSASGEFGEANMYKLATTLQGGEGDLIFTDEDSLKFLANDGALEDLSVHFDELGINETDTRIAWEVDYYGKRIAAGIILDVSEDLKDYIIGENLIYLAIPDYTINTEQAYIIAKGLIK